MRSSALLLACALPLSAAAAEMRFTGQAMPLNGDNLLYEEQHVVTGKCTDGLFRPASHHQNHYVHEHNQWLCLNQQHLVLNHLAHHLQRQILHT